LPSTLNCKRCLLKWCKRHLNVVIRSDLLNENEKLTEKLSAMKTEGGILKESEKELAKRNIGHQKVVQMLTEKLRGT